MECRHLRVMLRVPPKYKIDVTSNTKYFIYPFWAHSCLYMTHYRQELPQGFCSKVSVTSYQWIWMYIIFFKCKIYYLITVCHVSHLKYNIHALLFGSRKDKRLLYSCIFLSLYFEKYIKIFLPSVLLPLYVDF